MNAIFSTNISERNVSAIDFRKKFNKKKIHKLQYPTFYLALLFRANPCPF
jgi:hypothetical protein